MAIYGDFEDVQIAHFFISAIWVSSAWMPACVDSNARRWRFSFIFSLRRSSSMPSMIFCVAAFAMMCFLCGCVVDIHYRIDFIDDDKDCQHLSHKDVISKEYEDGTQKKETGPPEKPEAFRQNRIPHAQKKRTAENSPRWLQNLTFPRA